MIDLPVSFIELQPKRCLNCSFIIGLFILGHLFGNIKADTTEYHDSHMHICMQEPSGRTTYMDSILWNSQSDLKQIAKEFADEWKLQDSLIEVIINTMGDIGKRRVRQSLPLSIDGFYQHIFIPCLKSHLQLHEGTSFIQIGAHVFFPPSTDESIYHLTQQFKFRHNLLVEADPTIFFELKQRRDQLYSHQNSSSHTASMFTVINTAACESTNHNIKFYSLKKHILDSHFGGSEFKTTPKENSGLYPFEFENEDGVILTHYISPGSDQLGSLHQDTFGKNLFGTSFWSERYENDNMACYKALVDESFIQCLSPEDLIHKANLEHRTSPLSPLSRDDFIFVVIDTEGTDAEIFLSMLASGWRPLVVQLEYNHAPQFCEQLGQMEEFGYFVVAKQGHGDLVLAYSSGFDTSQEHIEMAFDKHQTVMCIEEALRWS